MQIPGAPERRASVRHGKYAKPELLATGPNQVWSWDITKLLGPQKWTYFYLYVLLDIFSRYVVGWMVTDREHGVLAKALIAEACEKQQIQEDRLTIHSDRGGPMTGKQVAHLMADLGVTKSLSRPQVSHDNPFSEAQFKTLGHSVGRFFDGTIRNITTLELDTIPQKMYTLAKR
jgi:putative transposase